MDKSPPAEQIEKPGAPIGDSGSQSSRFADLHLHTSFSDGTYSPEELTEHGHRNGLSAMALTDHDTVEGCLRMASACEKAGIEFVPGTELTAEVDGYEVHLLGYFLDLTNARFLAEMSSFQNVRQDRIREMVARLNEIGIPLKEETVFKLANCRSPGRPHVARALIQEGFCTTMDEAFERFLKKHRRAWVPKRRMSAADAIALVHEANGLAVLAHPGLNRTDDMIPALVEAGLDGIECFHTKHNPAMAEHYLSLAARHRLLVSGGSDCHGMSKGRPLIGTVKLDFRYYEALRDAATARRLLRSPLVLQSSS